MWKDIPGYEGLYQIDTFGQCKRLESIIECKNGNRQLVHERMLKPQFNKHCGYYQYELSRDGISKAYFVHRLLAMVFLPNPNNLPVVNHIDGNKLNNEIHNLEWCTYEDNSKHAVNTGLIDKDKMIAALSKGWQLSKDNSHGIRCIDDDKEFRNKEDASQYYNCSKDAILESIVWGRQYYKIGKRFEYTDGDRQSQVLSNLADFKFHRDNKHSVISIHDNVRFKTRTEAARFYGIDKCAVDRSLLLHQRTSTGQLFEWHY